MFSTVAAPVCIPSDSALGLAFLHTEFPRKKFLQSHTMFKCPHDQEIVHLCNKYLSTQHRHSFPLDRIFHSGLSLGSFPHIKTAIRKSWTCWPLPCSVLTSFFAPPPTKPQSPPKSAELGKSLRE